MSLIKHQMARETEPYLALASANAGADYLIEVVSHKGMLVTRVPLDATVLWDRCRYDFSYLHDGHLMEVTVGGRSRFDRGVYPAVKQIASIEEAIERGYAHAEAALQPQRTIVDVRPTFWTDESGILRCLTVEKRVNTRPAWMANHPGGVRV